MIAPGLRPGVAHRSSWYRALTTSERARLAAGHAVNHDLARRRLAALVRRDLDGGPDSLHEIRGCTRSSLVAALGSAPSELRLLSGGLPWLDELLLAFESDGEARFAQHIERLEAGDVRRLLKGIGPLVDVAMADVARLVEASSRAGETVEPFLDGLAGSLSDLAIQVLIVELNVARMGGRLEGSTPAERFRSFEDRFGEPEQVLEWLVQYPVLARRLVERVEQWRTATSELIRRLIADERELDRVFGDGDLGSLVAVKSGLGDRHRGGRTVTALTFSSGRRVVYKPRPLRAEARLQETIAWLNGRASISLPARPILDRGPYGWDRHLEWRPCASPEEVDRFFERVGGLLALFLVLRGGDLHFDNVLAHGEWPFVVDAEAIFRMQPTVAAGREHAVVAALEDSVLATGLLPHIPNPLSSRFDVDLSATGVRPTAPIALDAALLTGSGTDELALRRGTHHLRDVPSLPKLGQETVDPSLHTERILAGFEDVYRALARDRTELKEVLSAFGDDPIRAVLRPTRVYGELRLAAGHPACLRDALEADAVYDHLAIRPVAAHPLAAVESERAQLLSGDIPVFNGTPRATTITAPDGSRVEGLPVRSGLDAVMRRIDMLDEGDLCRQRWLIRAAAGDLPGSARQRRTSETPSASGWFEAAAEIARTLTQLAFQDGDRSWWIGVEPSAGDRAELRPLGFDLYDGTPGIVLFLATFGALARDAPAARVAEGGARSIVDFLESNESDALRSPGAFTGWAGLAYVLARLAVLCSSDDHVEHALECLARGAEVLDGDDSCCVVSGAAGLAIVAAGVHSLTGSARARAVASAAAGTLRELAADEGAHLVWRAADHDGRQLTGLAHGAAGIGWALSEAGRSLDDPSLVALAEGAFAFEREMFDPTAGNWRDLRRREDGPRAASVAWCHGAPGIGLSRALAASVGRQALAGPLADELDVAMATTATSSAVADHSLCHGELGKVDVLLTSGLLADRPDVVAAAQLRARTVLDRARSDAWLLNARGGAPAPGLMSGLAGIGYELLRLASPRGVPSVLALRLKSG